jgi:4-amino-4-deoxy-L-arabinose transferase-like glycosyltransferase
MTDRTRLTVLQAAVVFGVCAFLFYFGLGAFGLVGADEPRYAQISREMLTRHHWILPTLNGSPWLEKPVLLYWKIINSYMILGVHDWAARLPSAVHATALVMVVFFFMRRFRPGSELDAALITASMAGVVGFARGASTDMPLSASFSIALLSWWAWHETGRKLWLAAFYILLAVGALTKGPVAPALAVLIVAAYSAARRDGKIFFSSFWAPGFALFFAVTAPWYVAIEMKAPQFFRVFLVEHNLARFGTNLYQHAQPFWYYLPVFLLATLPWVVFTLPALVDAGRAFWRELRSSRGESALTAPPSTATAPEAGGARDDLPVFLFIWILIPIVFFSISRSKLPGYILPAIPAAAILTADYLHRRKVIARLQLMLHSLLCGAIIAAALLVPWVLLRQAVPDRTKTIIVVTTGIIAIVVLVLVRRGGLRLLRLATLVPVVLALAFLLRPAAIVIDNALSARTVNFRLKELGIGNAPVAVFNRRDLAYGLTFYRNQPVAYYEPRGPRDLPSGILAQDHVVIAKAGSGDAVRAVLGPRQVTRLGDFTPQHLEFFLVSNPK